jgi:hypothetical protein
MQHREPASKAKKDAAVARGEASSGPSEMVGMRASCDAHLHDDQVTGAGLNSVNAL